MTVSYDSMMVLRIEPTQAGTLPSFLPGERDASTKDVLRLKLDAKFSHEQIAASLKVSKGVVSKYVDLAAAGLDWPTLSTLDEGEIERCLLFKPERPSAYVVSERKLIMR